MQILARILISLLLFGAATANADTHTANTCSVADVQAAINAAADGDSVSIPSGNCTWSSSVSLNGSVRSLDVYGAGQANTIITFAASGSRLGITLGSGKLLKLHDMTFKYTGGSTYAVGISGNGGANSFRFHNLTIDSTGATAAFAWFYFSGVSYGVLDHLTGTGVAEMLVNWTGGNASLWGVSDGPGTANAIFIEDSTLNWTGHNEGNPVFDTQTGGRVVFRYNTSKNHSFGNHGADSGMGIGGLLAEIYGNDITLNDDGSHAWNITGAFRAGQVIFYNNDYTVDATVQFGGTSTVTASIPLRIYRTPGGGFETGSWNYDCAVGNELRFCSNASFSVANGVQDMDCKTDADCTGTNSDGRARGDVCKWKMCSGSMTLCDPANGDADCPGSETCIRYADGGTTATSGRPCFNGLGLGVNNLPSPCYQWGNTLTGSTHSGRTFIFQEAQDTLLINEDYYNAELSYTPYTYPHPLAGGSDVDATPPYRYGGSPSGSIAQGTTQTTVSVVTSDSTPPSYCRHSDSPGTAWASMTAFSSEADGVNHSYTKTGLTDGGTYDVYVKCQDSVTPTPNTNTDDYHIAFSVSSGTPQTPSAPSIVGVTLEGASLQ